MKNKKISRKRFLEIWKDCNEFELIGVDLTEESLEDSTKVLNMKGHIKAFMKTSTKNNDKLDFIIDQIKEMNSKMDNGFKELNFRMDNLEIRMDKLEKDVSLIMACPTIKKEISQIQK